MRPIPASCRVFSALVLVAFATNSQAATITKAATGTELTSGASWTGSTAPGSGDAATWASTSLGASLTLGSSSSWGGIGVASALTAIGVTGAGPLTLGAGGIDMSAAATDLTWGTPIALGASQTWNVNSGRTLTASGIISGSSMGLTKAGLGTLTLKGANTYDGTTTILGGTLVADTASTATVLNSSSPLTFTSSGTFQLKGLSAQTRSQTVNGLTLTSGAAIIDANNTGTSTTIDLRGSGGSLSITRSVGTTVDFKATTGTFGTTALVKTAQANDTTGILGAWATVNTGADWAINNGSGVATAYIAYNTLSGTTLATGGTVNYRVATNPATPTGNITLATTGTIDINTMRISDAAVRTIDVRNGTTQGILRCGAVGGLLISGINGHIIGVSGTGTAGTITAGGADNTAGELIVNTATNSTINSVIANNGTGIVSLTKSGAGTLTLANNTNSFTGPTVVNAGTLTVSPTSGALGTGTPNVTVQSGATLNLSVSGLTMGSGGTLYLNGGTLQLAYNGGTPNWQGAVILNANSIINTSSSGNGGQITGNISGSGGLTKTGGDIMWLRGTTNNYSGPTVVSAGRLQFRYSLYGNNTSLWTPANLTVANGAGLALNVGGTSEFTASQAGTLWADLATVQNNGLQNGSAMCFDITNAGSTVQTVAATLTDSTGPGGGAVGLRVFGASGGTLELTGPNTYSGVTGIDNGGTLKVSSLNSVNGGSPPLASSSLGRPTTTANGTIWLGHPALTATYGGANLTYTGAGETTDRVINLGGANNAAYTLDQSGSGLLKFTSSFTMTDLRGPQTITLQGNTAGTGEIAGVIPNGDAANPNRLTKSGSGTWMLSNANIYAGVTTVTGGCLVLTNANALPGGIGATGGTSALTFNGGVLGLGAGDFTRSLAAAGTVSGVCFTGNGGWAAYGADRAVNLGGASATVAWVTANTGLNAKTLILGNATATHTVDFQNPLDMGAATRTVQVDDGAAAIDGKLSGSLTNGNLTKTGLGTLALTGSNSYAGATTASAGTLLVNGTNSGTGLITVASGATLGGTGSIAGAATFSSGGKAVFTITRDPVTQANTTPLTIAGVMTYNSTEIHLNVPANLPSGIYTLAASSATPAGTVTATPVLDSGSYAAGFTSAVVSLNTANKKLLLTVNGLPTNPTQLAIAAVNGGVSPIATGAFSVVVQAQDANGTARPVLTNTAVTLSLNTGSGPLSGTLTGTILAGSASVTITGVIYGTAESGVALTATRTSGDSLTSANSAPFTVLSNTTPASLTVTGFPSPQGAGSAGSVTVTAKTVSGVTVTNYAGTVHFTSNDSQAVLPADYTFVAGDNGTHTFPDAITLKTAGPTQSITATDTVTPTITGAQAGITVTPSTATVLVVTGFPSPQPTGVAGSVIVTAKDIYNNTATSYVGTIHFTSSDVAASLPANYTFVGGDAGSHAFTNGVTFNTAGTQSITATDTVASSITGTQSGITAWVAPSNFTWRSAGSGNWSDATKWNQSSGVDYAPLTAGQSNYILNFIAGTYTATHNLSNGFVANQLNFAGAVTVDGSNSLAFASNGGTLPQLNQNSTNGVSISIPLALNANLACGGSGNGSVALSGVISGTGSLTKSSTGTMTLSGANTYNGGTIVSAGSLQMGSTANNLLGTGTVTVNSGATLALNGNNNLTNSFVFNGASVTDGNSFSANINGPITLGATTSFDLQTSGNMSLGGNINGPGGLTKKGTVASPLIISGVNSFTGPVTVLGGTLQVSSINSVSGGTATSSLGAPTTVDNGTISLGSTTTSVNLIYTGAGETTDRVIKLAGTTGGATLTLSGPRSGLLKFTSNVAIPGTASADNHKTLTLTGAGTTANGSISGSGEISGCIGDSPLGTAGQLATSVTKAGTNTWTLSGSNTYSGATQVQAGTLAFSQATSLGTGSLDITTGAVAALNYIGTRQITALTFNAGSALPNGTYGSSASNAANKNDTYFSGPGTVTVGTIANPTITTLALTSGGNPSNGGVSLTFTATVAGAAPTGTVMFYDGITLIGTGTLNGSYQTGFTTPYLTAGAHMITALYAGNTGNSQSASAALSQTVVETRSASTIALALTGGGNPSNFGTSVTFTATVTGVSPTGNVVFYNGSAVLGTSVLNASRQASLSTGSLAVGWRAITARYLGDANNAPGGPTASLFQTVNPLPGNGKLKVFILAGQSNMQGKGPVETGRDPNNYSNTSLVGGLGSLRNMLNKNPNKYGYLADPANLTPEGNPGWLTRSDVWVTYWSDPGTGENRNGKLDANFGDTGGQGRIGPEYAFGLTVGSQLADPVLLIKYAFGGKSLIADFRPPSSGGTVGPYYTGMVARVRQVLGNLTTYYPAYGGQGYEIAGFAWHQGWNDLG